MALNFTPSTELKKASLVCSIEELQEYIEYAELCRTNGDSEKGFIPRFTVADFMQLKHYLINDKKITQSAWKSYIFNDFIDVDIQPNREIEVSLAGINVIGASKKGKHPTYSNIDFSGVNLEGTNFENINFADCKFNECNMRNIRIVNCNMNKVEMHKTILTGGLIAGGEFWEQFKHDMNKYVKPISSGAFIGSALATGASAAMPVFEYLGSGKWDGILRNWNYNTYIPGLGAYNKSENYRSLFYGDYKILGISGMVVTSAIAISSMAVAAFTLVVTMVGATCCGLRLIGANLQDSKMSGCDFTNMAGVNVTIKGCKISNSNFTNADCSAIQIENTKIDNSQFIEAKFLSSNLATSTIIENCDFSKSRFVDTSINMCIQNDCKIEDVTLDKNCKIGDNFRKILAQKESLKVVDEATRATISSTPNEMTPPLPLNNVTSPTSSPGRQNT